MKARKKSVVVEAFRMGMEQIPDWFMDKVTSNTVILSRNANETYCHIETLEVTMRADYGDYIIRGVNGELYPCKPDIFEKTYDVVDDDEIDLQLTVEEINALICYISKSIGVLNGDLLNVLKMAYMVGEEDLSSCINAVEKLQKQKEMLENGNC